jgi:hypothetical protein
MWLRFAWCDLKIERLSARVLSNAAPPKAWYETSASRLVATSSARIEGKRYGVFDPRMNFLNPGKRRRL